VKRRSLLQLLPATAVATFVAPGLFFKSAASAAPKVSLGLNFTGTVYWSTEFPFSNLAYNAAPWRVQKFGESFTWDTPLPPMTDDGYPLAVPAKSYIESFLIFTPHRGDIGEEVSVYYDGKGTLDYANGARLQKRKSGYDEVRNLTDAGSFTVRLLKTDPSDPLRNIRVYQRGAIPKGTFRPAFLERLKGMQTLRFMDWMATNNSTVRRWSERPTVGIFGRSDRGVPIEIMVELANVTKIAPWFTLPHLADDDYIRRFAEMVKSSLDPSLKIYVEYSNEVWNSMFKQAGYASEQGMAAGLADNPYQAQLAYYSQRTSEMLAIWEDVFSGSRDRVIGVYAAQSANEWTSDVILSTGEASKYCDVLAIAPYFGNALGSPDTANDVAGWSLDKVFDVLSAEIEGENLQAIRKQAELARKFGVMLVAYEGGQHLAGHHGAENNKQLTKLMIAANRDPRMGALTARHLELWASAGGGVYALYASMVEPSKWGSWGLLEYEGSSSPKWDAVQKLLGR
jgi:hypothetical protein